MRNGYFTLRQPLIMLVLTALLPAAVRAGDFHEPPYKLDRRISPPYRHLQLDNERNGFAIRVESPTRAVAYRVDPNGAAHQLARIDGAIESIQTNAAQDRARAFVRSTGSDRAMSQWHFSTTGKHWVLQDSFSKFLELDSLGDGRVLLAEKLANGVVLQLRSADGTEQGRILLRGETFTPGDGDSAGNPLRRFALLRDGSGVIERGPTVRTDDTERSAVITRFWNGETKTSWIPGIVLDHHGFDRDRIFIQTKGDNLFVAAAGGVPQPVNMHGQTVRRLDWAGDGTLRMVHGDQSFVAESYLHANGRAKAQWVRSRKFPAPGLSRTALGPQLAQLDRAGVLSGQTRWSGRVRTSYLSDPSAPDAAMVVALDSANAFTPLAYPWPDDAVYSPDMRWMLRRDASGRYAIVPARALSDAQAISMLKKFEP